jgi:hypothetical protein
MRLKTRELTYEHYVEVFGDSTQNCTIRGYILFQNLLVLSDPHTKGGNT